LRLLALKFFGVGLGCWKIRSRSARNAYATKRQEKGNANGRSSIAIYMPERIFHLILFVWFALRLSKKSSQESVVLIS